MFYPLLNVIEPFIVIGDELVDINVILAIANIDFVDEGRGVISEILQYIQ